MTPPNNQSQWVEYVNNGLAITPIRSGSKQPVLPNWSEKSEAITTERQVHILSRGMRRKLNGSAGVLLAHCDTPLMTLDIDNWSLAEPWFAERGIDLGDLFTSPDAVQIQSGRQNKAKLVFSLDAPMVHHVIKDQGETIIEFRCQNSSGGSLQDILPPSIHPDTGAPYKWHGDWRNIPKIPDALRTIWQSLLDEKAHARTVRTETPDIPSTTRVADISRALDKVPASSLSYDEWVAVAMSIHSECPDEVGMALFDRWSAIDEERYDLDAVIRLWNSIKPGGGITIGTLFGMVPKTTVDFPPAPSITTTTDKPMVLPIEPVQSFDNEELSELLSTSIAVPGNFIDNIASGETIFKTARELGMLYRKERQAFQLLGSGRLEQVDAKMLPSIVDELSRRSGKPIKGVFSGTHGTPVVKTTRLKRTESEILLASATVEELDEIRILSPTPFITEDGTILHKGYHPDYEVLVTGGRVDEVEFHDAVNALDELLCDFQPFEPADKSRMMASLLTPAFKPSKMITQSPLFFFSSDQSQAGKGLYAETAPCIYDCVAENVKYRPRGVGSFEETVDSALIAGRQFINLDNFKGSLNSGWFEGLITAGASSHSARVPHIKTTVVDTTACNWSLTSNGVRGTEDLVNRMAIVKLRKHSPGHPFRYDSKEGFHQHIRDNKEFYLGCVLSIVQHWIKDGKPQGSDGGHSFITWSKTLDYIVQNYFDYPPLMEGMAEAKRTVGDPVLSWVRLVCIAIANDDQLNEQMSATELANALLVSNNGADELPSGRPLGSYGETQISMTMGQTLGKVRRIAKKSGTPDGLSIDGYRITWEQVTKRHDKWLDNPQWLYTITMDGQEDDYSDVPF